jgi:hypothetical protein
MNQTISKEKIFADIFGFDPLPGETVSDTKPKEPMPESNIQQSSFEEKKATFANIFGYVPELSEPVIPASKQTDLSISSLPASEDTALKQPIGASRSFEAPTPDIKRPIGVSRSFDVEPQNNQDQIPIPQLSDNPEVAAIESRFYSISDPRAKALELKSLPMDKGAELLQKLPEQEQAPVRVALEKLANEDRKANAFALGILNSTPAPAFFPEETKQEMQKTAEAAPVASAAGQIAGTIGQTVIGAKAIGGLLDKAPAIAQSPLLKTALTRIATAGTIAAEQNIGRKEIGEAIDDVAQQSGGALISLVPEVLVPPGVAQIIAQPLADLIYDAAVGKGRGQDIASKEWWKNEAIALATSFGFAIKDVASGKTFQMEQTAQRKELANLFKKKPDAEVEFVMPKERSDKLNELIKKNLESVQRPSSSNVIIDESPQFEPANDATTPEGINAFRNIRKPPTEADLQRTVDAGEETPYINRYEQQSEPQPNSATGNVRPEALPSDARSEPGRTPESPNTRQTVDFFRENRELESLTPESLNPKINQKIADELDALDRTAKTISTEASNAEGNGTGLEAQGEQNGEFRGLEAEAGGYSTRGEEPVSLRSDAQTGLETGTGNETGFEQIDPETLPKRQKGILSEVGAVGGKGQLKLQFDESDVNNPAYTAQQKFEKQRNDVRKKFVVPLKQKVQDAVDYFGAGLVDREYFAKRLLSKTAEGDKAVGKLNAAKGNSAEAKAQYENSEKTISEYLSHDTEEIFSDYLQAKRILEIEQNKGAGNVKHTGGMTAEEARANIYKVENDLPKEKSDAIKLSAQRYWEEMSSQLKQLYDNGLITEESFKNLSEQGRTYSPRKFIQHIDPDRISTDSKGRAVSVSDSGIKSLDTGSEEAMVNNWRLLLSEVTARTQSRIFKNKATKELYNYVKSTPENEAGLKEEILSENAKVPPGYERIYTVIDGEKKSILAPTKFAQSWNAADQGMSRGLAKVLNMASGAFLVRPLATGALAPEFAVSNIPRDAAMQWLVAKEYSTFAPKALFEVGRNFAKVARDAWTGEGRYRDYIKQGGGIEFMYEQGAMFRDPTRPVSATAERNRQIFKYATKLQEFSERLGRLALREQALIKGKSPEDATRIAREYLDFGQGGSWTKAIDSAVPYLNASVQGTRSVVRAAKADPVTFGLKALQLMTVGAGLAYTANKFNPETTEKISDREKVTRWNFPLPLKTADGNSTYFSIPKDQSSRLFATLGETIAERQLGKISGDTAWRKIKMAWGDINPIDIISYVPPTMKAIIGYTLNKDFWTEETIWKGRKVSPSKEFYEGYTPKPLVDAADLLSNIGIEISPARAESSLGQVMPKNMITALMGGAYDQITGNMSAKQKQIVDKQAIDQLTQIPGFRKYFRKAYPDRTDVEKLAEGMDKFGISPKDEKDRRKTNRMLQEEVDKKTIAVNDIKQSNDAKLKIISRLFLAGDKQAALKKWKVISKEAIKTLGKDEVARIEKRLNSELKKNVR